MLCIFIYICNIYDWRFICASRRRIKCRNYFCIHMNRIGIIWVDEIFLSVFHQILHLIADVGKTRAIVLAAGLCGKNDAVVEWHRNKEKKQWSEWMRASERDWCAINIITFIMINAPWLFSIWLKCQETSSLCLCWFEYVCEFITNIACVSLWQRCASVNFLTVLI